MRGYTQLVHEQRYQIYSLMKAGLSQTEFAEDIGVHKSTISREVSRNQGQKGYRPKQAHSFAESRQFNRARGHISDGTWQTVETLIREDWSPEQISSWFKLFTEVSVSHEWIYQYIYQDKYSGDNLHKHLRCQKKRRKRYSSYSHRGQLINRVSIDERPAK
ncbi:MAG: IS30 family transposase [Arenicellales bacterium]